MTSIATTTPRLLARAEGAVGWLTFNAPERRNAMSLDMWLAVPPAIAALESQPDVRAIVLTGAGDKAFVSGADISEFQEARATPADEAKYRAITDAAFAAIANANKPTIAMIRGFCMGGGLAIALSADMRIAATGSRYAIPAAKLGLGYRFNGLATLVSIVGPAFAREIMSTARQFSDEEALRMGLINRLVAPEALDDTIAEYAKMIAANAPKTILAARRAIAETLKTPEERDLAGVDKLIEDCFASADYAEGRTAFLEKRSPKFVGK
jgi:enoyl-CoA hydratase/carnithine racemase